MNKKNNLRIIECKDDNKWDNFIKHSFNKNFYSLSDLLNLDKSTKKYFLFKNNEIQASFCLNENNKKILEPKYRIYSPINYIDFKNSKVSSINTNYYNINNFIYKFLTDNYKEINITFDYITKDIRPFLWHGFPEYKQKFNLNIRYTYISNIKNLDKSNYLSSFIYLNSSETNRREIRNSLKKNYKFEEIFSKEIFLKLKNTSYNIHNKKINLNYYNQLLTCYDTLNKKSLLKMYVTFKSNEPVFMNVFGIINSKSIFLQSGRTEVADNDNLIGVYTMINSLFNLSKQNTNTIDFEGINSPNNSKSKTKYGGFIKPYYSLKL